ncbi:MAG: hypothetical protein U0736_20955 [Gemmataceae bacterium]
MRRPSAACTCTTGRRAPPTCSSATRIHRALERANRRIGLRAAEGVKAFVPVRNKYLLY